MAVVGMAANPLVPTRLAAIGSAEGETRVRRRRGRTRVVPQSIAGLVVLTAAPLSEKAHPPASPRRVLPR
jgi:hypothetical protein